MKRKVGIVTFHNHSNYGAVLQAYSLKYVLEKMGVETSFLCDRKNAAMQEDAFHKSGSEKNDKEDKVSRHVRRIMHERMLVFQKAQDILFSDFVSQYLKETSLTEGRDLNQEFDFFLAGSDQIWNYEITGIDPFWFLDFAQKEKRFSYAASFGMDVLPEKGKGWYQKQLQDFSRISVREESGKEIVRELLKKEISVCPDPVFLPPTEVWEKRKVSCEESVVVYMTEFDEALYYAAKEQAEMMQVPLIYLGYMNVLSYGYKPISCSPLEWLGYLYHAKVVYTNSFHGIAFSIFFIRRCISNR